MLQSPNHLAFQINHRWNNTRLSESTCTYSWWLGYLNTLQRCPSLDFYSHYLEWFPKYSVEATPATHWAQIWAGAGARQFVFRKASWVPCPQAAGSGHADELNRWTGAFLTRRGMQWSPRLKSCSSHDVLEIKMQILLPDIPGPSKMSLLLIT